jgi:hypothetical protein
MYLKKHSVCLFSVSVYLSKSACHCHWGTCLVPCSLWLSPLFDQKKTFCFCGVGAAIIPTTATSLSLWTTSVSGSDSSSSIRLSSLDLEHDAAAASRAHLGSLLGQSGELRIHSGSLSVQQGTLPAVLLLPRGAHPSLRSGEMVRAARL